MASLLDQLRKINNVEILGAPALLAKAMETDVVRYVEQGYSKAEEVNFALTGRTLWPAAPNPTTTAQNPVPQPTLSLPYSTQRVTIPSWSAPFFVILMAEIAATRLIDGNTGGICADVFSEVSLNNGVRWPTAQTGQSIAMILGNTDTTQAREPRVTLTGIRLRD